jgi:hypothetical protein
MKLIIHTGLLLAEVALNPDETSTPMHNCSICKQPRICKNKDRVNAMGVSEIVKMNINEKEMWCSKYNPVRKRLI